MSDVVSQFSLSVHQVRGYEFLVKFHKDSIPDLRTDEGPPLGQDAGPSPTRMLAAAVGNCLAASLLFACGKAGVPAGVIHADVNVQIVRNEKRRQRIGRIEVTLDAGIDPANLEKAREAAAVFEDFCTVTQSVRQGIAVEVKMKGLHGE